MYGFTRGIVTHLLVCARDLSVPGDPSDEYVRGQSNLIIDACGLRSEHAELVTACITHRATVEATVAQIEDADLRSGTVRIVHA